jgi:predicted ATPase
MRQVLATWQAIGQETGRLMYLAPLAEQCGHAGQVEAGLHVLTETLASSYSRGQRLWEPELYRVRGTLLLQAEGVTPDVPRQATDVEAETCFQLALARRQGAKMFELRAVLGLSRLWQRQGKREEAREFLTPLYSWFTEGFDTADLWQTKALLAELGV